MSVLIRWDPFGELDRLASWMSGPRRPAMPMDAYRRGDHFVVHFDLPGVDPDSIDVTVERNVLTVRAERRFVLDHEDEAFVTERPQGTFTRQLFLGDTLEVDKLEANYDRGVLTITIPVAEEARPRRIEISEGAHAKAISAGTAA